jgi:DNA-directed RNA polymerase specialized sigma24 family protein
VGGDRGVHRDPDSADRVAVRVALGELSRKQREAVILRYFLDLTAEQTARLTASSPGAVRGLTHRAMVVLRDHLKVTEMKEPEDVT